MNRFTKFIKKLKLRIRFLKKGKVEYKSDLIEVHSRIVYCNDYMKLLKDGEDQMNCSNIVIEFRLINAFDSYNRYLRDLLNLISQMEKDFHLNYILKHTPDIIYFYLSGSVDDYNTLLLETLQDSNTNLLVERIIPLLYTLPKNGFEDCIKKGILQESEFKVDTINYKSELYKLPNSKTLGGQDFINFDNPKYFDITESPITTEELLHLSKITYTDSNIEELCIEMGHKAMSIISLPTEVALSVWADASFSKTFIDIMNKVDYFMITENKNLSDYVQDNIEKLKRYSNESINFYENIDEIID